ncbi:xanthine dehydrogenase family protein subunit M [Fertoebacter nigrum]|uniref:Xanthine dehydrogenase family protein subunit M n=1 Tax=Fertoeibacter niger TaxID=2656921 RepID=A0A8X8H351_9RHOB|nr:xanthine dehydrogenase family protein subunit M [Fertoeibacter niger]NUB46466.1 xanthine dehydrogenase family protein subunit M [Fertoeibacter niger]
MRPFQYLQPATLADVIVAQREAPSAVPATFLAGGTTLIDLMKLGVMQPERVVDLRLAGSDFAQIRFDGATLRLGAFARMAEVADHPVVAASFPVIAQSLSLAASPQLRNMATLGGNVLQRTRCAYFRDPTWAACNKRTPGSGCAAVDGANRQHAVLGTSSQCIATYHGDFAQALMALDASVVLGGPAGTRTIPFAALHRLPGNTPHVETTLHPGEIILDFVIPAGPWASRSLYLKIRDRQSYEYAVASAAVAVAMNGDVVADARIALGGLAAVPWRAHEAEAILRDAVLDEATATRAAEASFAAAVPQSHNAFKIALGRDTLVRALLQAASMEVRHD